jgi:dihydroflavonol-4-reductase
MADGFKVAKPNKPVNRLISALVWRLDKVRCLFTGARPLVTKETTASAFAVHRYDNTKSLAFPGFTYGNLKEQINRSCQILEQSLLLA